MKRILTACLLAILVSPALLAQAGATLSLHASPFGTVPMGSSADCFAPGLGGGASVGLSPVGLRGLGVEAGGGFAALPLRTQDSIRLFSASVGPAYSLPVTSHLSFYASASGGYYYWQPVGWDAAGSNGGGLAFGGGAGARLRLPGPFSLAVSGAYDHYLQLYNGLRLGLSVEIDIPITANGRSGLEIRDVELVPLFPVLYHYYDTHPVGTVTVTNVGDSDIHDLTVSLLVRRYMDDGGAETDPVQIRPGEERQLELYGLFTEELMSVTEGTKVSAALTVSYTIGDEPRTSELAAVLEVHNRNAMTWDDDRKLGSFVTAKDPAVLSFARNVVTWMQPVKNPALDPKLQDAMAVFAALRAFGIRYQADPSTPHATVSEDGGAVDFLQFPRQTLTYSSGDCDDLTALYIALLESVGVDTAFITVPGHIYAAFAVESSPDEARRAFVSPNDLIYAHGRAWVPIETTMVQSGFDQAWTDGARTWRERSAADEAKLLVTSEAWEIYRPVGFSEGTPDISLPRRERLVTEIEATIDDRVERRLRFHTAELEAKLADEPQCLRLLNRLAVIYARYGRYDQALGRLEQVVAIEEFAPALTNMANIYLIKEDYHRAVEFYERSIAKDHDRVAPLLGAAQCHYELGNHEVSASRYRLAESLDPEIAERFAYLRTSEESETRASSPAESGSRIMWDTNE